MYKTILVVDNFDLMLEDDNLSIITFEQYLSDYPKLNEPKIRIINLCNTEHYLSRGYYCSLLAEARKHKVLPSVSTINDLRNLSKDSHSELVLPMPTELSELIADGHSVEFLIYFGRVDHVLWEKIARQIFDRYPAPILGVCLSRNANGLLIRVKEHALAQLSSAEYDSLSQHLQSFTKRLWNKKTSKRHSRWDIAILVNHEERYPPSDKSALKRFVKAAAKVGIYAEIITAQQESQIAQYDGLFIRETTAIDHYTYRLARKAEQEGLVVIDDSTSILRCCNKVFLHDAFSYSRVPSPKTKVVINNSTAALDDIEEHFGYPVVIKLPEGSFSKGIYKIDNRAELKDKLSMLLSNTALVLAQEYLYTDFDWRVGVLNGRAVYACRYYMARNHWQIYNHASKRFPSGHFETLPTFEVPGLVLDAALKATSIIGKGLYGVDLKQKGQDVYVIEVNDNPNIDHKVEDLYLGNELYMLIMNEFLQRLEQRGR